MTQRFSVRIALASAMTVLCLTSATHAADNPPPGAEPPPAVKAEIARLQGILNSLHPQKGDVTLTGSGATLHLGDNFYFLNSADAKKVLVEGWKNPPDAVTNVMGMIFPKGKTFVDDTWGAVVSYDGMGYVSDKEAKTTDYDKLLTQMRSGEDEANDDRKKQNLDPIFLVGWAQAPTYDPVRHSLVWARDLKIGDKPDHTLNYDVRELGRRGVLSLNIVSTMSDLPAVRTAASSLADVGSFDSGSRYTDFREGSDKKSAYGIAGLVAAGAGVALAQKFGLFAIGLLVLKKFGILIAAGFAGLFARFRNIFRKKPTL